MKQIVIILCLLAAAFDVCGQELTVKRMEVAPMDLSASTQPRNDLNGNPCALVKVQLAVEGVKFEGNVIGDVAFKDGEYWVYMSQGSYMLNIKHKSFVPLFVNFRDYDIKKVEGKVTYVLTLVMPQMGEEKKKQKLIINYTPKEAMVLIDSKPYTGKGHVEDELPLGEHTYVIAAAGYITAEGTIKLNANGPRVLNEQLMKESSVADAHPQSVQVPSVNPHSDKSNAQLPTTYSSEKRSEEIVSSTIESKDGNEMTLRQMVLHPFGVLPDRDGLRKEEVKSGLLSINKQWDVLENMGGELHVHGFTKTYKGKSMSVMCDFDYRKYDKLSYYSYYFAFKKKDEAQSFLDALLKDMLLEGMQVDGQKALGDNVSIKTVYKGRLLELSMDKRKSSYKYGVKLNVTPYNMKTFEVGEVQFRMIHVEGGSFMMGSDNSEASSEKPEHQETLKDYYIGETEVTQKLWEAVMGNNPSNYMYAPCPVVRVSWDDCQKFIQKLNEMIKDDDGHTFRLPTEAEWEFAARGGNKSGDYKYSGGNEIETVAWYEGNSEKKIHSVGLKSANELGLFDMSGNVWEWCQDWYRSYNESTNADLVGTTDEATRVIRGGSVSSAGDDCRSLRRGCCVPSNYSKEIGLRLAF